jgi:DNA methylase
VIHHGDCLDVMAAMEPESVDAICTDPPYGLEFMGKSWDRLGDIGTTSHSGPAAVAAGERGQYGKVSNFGSANRKCRKCGKWQWDHVGRKCECEQPDFPNVAHHQGLLMQSWHQRWAEAAYRVAKPSAYLMAFGGTRTVHRMTVALEDAGWIIRDMLVWAYASGFPKSKASLKPAWEPIVMARKPGPLRILAIDECRIPTDEPLSLHGRSATDNGWDPRWSREQTPGQTEGQALGRWPANVILTDPIFDGGVDSVVGGGEAAGSKPFDWTAAAERASFPVGREASVFYDDSGTYSRFFLIPKSDRSDREPTLYPFCTCETVKLSAWERRGRSQPVPMASTSRARATSEATSEADSASPTTLFGSSTSDLSPSGDRSTTSTATSRTTESRTSRPSTEPPTSDSTPAPSSSTASGGSDALSADSIESSNSPTGTSHPKAGPSTDGAARATSARSSRPSVCAECGKEVMPSRAARINAHPT